MIRRDRSDEIMTYPIPLYIYTHTECSTVIENREITVKHPVDTYDSLHDKLN